MPAQGRRNVHGKAGVRFKAAYTKSKYKNMLRNNVSELIAHEHITVTSGVAKDLISLTEKMVSLTKKEDQVHAKRLAMQTLRNIYVDPDKKVTVLDKLFNDIGPRFKDVNGGSVVTYKVENRRGDNANCVLIAFSK